MLHNNVYHFFMSASTPSGFVSHFSELTSYPSPHLIKGPSGSGKSTLIKRAASALSADGGCELIHCSADKDSLDAVILEKSGATFIDATPPHTLDAALPQVKEKVISLYDFFDPEKLAEKKCEIERAAHEEELLAQKYTAFIKAAGLLLSSNERIYSRFINREKLSNFLSRLCSREIKKHGGKGGLKMRYLSTISENGIFMLTDTARKMCSRIYAIDDPSGAASGIILEGLCEYAVLAGYTVYCCLCPLSDSSRIDHILIPELSLGFMTSNKFHPITDSDIKKIHTSRFYDREKLYDYLTRTSFQTRAAREMLKEAALLNAKKLKVHQRLEGYYVDACDFYGRDKYFDSFTQKLKP
ncbi:MAG: hypothetical protein IJY33_02520 [Oscillospiraceae bacterium]|nr:hypothetical protein [Oscillospiraceae bacterium]